jgi:hypothetical protein
MRDMPLTMSKRPRMIEQIANQSMTSTRFYLPGLMVTYFALLNHQLSLNSNSQKKTDPTSVGAVEYIIAKPF